MHKFRSMVADADKKGTDLTPQGDPRITAFGKLLRKTKMDELPQLIDVLKGNMSLVGPRPESPLYARHYNERQKQVLSVRPGIVGPAQIYYRHEELLLKGKEDPDSYYIQEIMPQKVEIDLHYIENRSFWGDMKILLKSFAAVAMLRASKTERSAAEKSAEAGGVS